MDTLKNLKYLPLEIVQHEILSYLNGKQLLFTNKTYYEKYMANLRSTELNTIAKESSKNAKDLFKFGLLI